MTRIRLRSVALALALLGAIAPTRGTAQEAGDWRLALLPGDGARARESVALTMTTAPDQQNGLPVPVDRLRGLTAVALRGSPRLVRFEITSDAGTVWFSGVAGGGSGSGTFRFAPSRTFVARLREMGVPGTPGTFDLYRLALRGTRTTELRALVAAMQRYGDSVPDAGEIVQLVSNGVDARAVAALGEAGLRGLAPHEVVRLARQGVDGAYAARPAGASGDAVREAVEPAAPPKREQKAREKPHAGRDA